MSWMPGLLPWRRAALRSWTGCSIRASPIIDVEETCTRCQRALHGPRGHELRIRSPGPRLRSARRAIAAKPSLAPVPFIPSLDRHLQPALTIRRALAVEGSGERDLARDIAWRGR